MSSEEAGTKELVVRLRGVSKEFPGVKAVDRVDLEILPGEVHALAGENGAGKSTLMKILSQVERPTEGELQISGEKVAFHGPGYAQSLGVAMVYQEFALAPHLSVAENLFLGREPARGVHQPPVGEGEGGGAFGPGGPRDRLKPPSVGFDGRRAAAAGDRQGPGHRGEGSHPGRADGNASGERDRGPL